MRFFILLFLLQTSLYAQEFNITGRILDATNAPLPDATVVAKDSNGIFVKGVRSNSQGNFEISTLSTGRYTLEVSYIGLETVIREFSITDRTYNLGDIALNKSSVTLDQIEVEGKAPIASQMGDTIQFNAAAFKTMKDASAEDLLQKMPSMQMTGGQMEAQGEKVAKVLVDGKPFFGTDPAAALKNLPAEVIDKIQVYDESSEQSQFSGVQDGNTLKTINIITKPDMRSGQFGKIYGGYGTDDRYQAGGNVNFFQGDRRISLIGMANNINIQNFSSEDILGVMGQSGGGRGGRGGFRGNSAANDFLVNSSGGITETFSLGINFSDNWGEKIEVTASYFANRNSNETNNDLFRQFIIQEGAGQTLASTSTTASNNLNHRFNMRMEIEIDSMNSLLFRPRISFQQNEGNRNDLSETRLEDAVLNNASTLFNSDYQASQIEANLLWRHKFTKARRTLSVELAPAMAPKRGNNQLASTNVFFVPEERSDILDQRGALNLTDQTLATEIEYTEPISELSQLSLRYRLSYKQDESDLITRDFDPMLGEYDQINTPLSSLFANDFWTQSTGLGYNFNRDRKFRATVRATYQHASLISDQTLPIDQQFKQTFTNILPFAFISWSPDKTHSYRLFYRSSTRLPAMEQLQNVVNNQNPLQLFVGNPNLQQSETHTLFTRYQHTDAARSRNFFILGSVGYTRDQIVNSLWYAGEDNPLLSDFNLPRGAQLVQPVNLDGAWTARAFTSYGLPVNFIKSNLNIDVTYNFSNNPGLINGARSEALNHVFSGGLTLSSNISEMLDFTVFARPAYNLVRNTANTTGNLAYLSQNSGVRFNWQIWEGFVFRTDFSHIYNGGLAEGFDQNFILWNIVIGKKLFKNERGEISISAYDILKQNRNISRSVTESWIEDTRTNALQQFFLLSFTYNIRHFGQATPSREESFGPGRSPR